jgi:hypothetical protein
MTPGEARSALGAWLLGPHIQISSGVQAGAAAGWTNRDGNATYVYPEITGYYLQWLAWHAATCGADDDVRGRASAAQRWLASWARAEAPPTRVYLRPSEPDWRNGALFFFDLAMVMRGLASATRMGLIEADAQLVGRMSELLLKLVADDGHFDACVRTDPHAPLPDRWSTRRGAFLSKAASGVLCATEQFPGMPPALEHAAHATFRAALDSIAHAPHADTHALLYGIEGALAHPARPGVVALLPVIEAQVRATIRSCNAMGHLPESQGDGLIRLDIVAQTIRVAALLAPDPATRSALETMTRTLVAHVDADLGIPFSPLERPGQYNAWTAMFAEQALLAAEQSSADLRLYLV